MIHDDLEPDVFFRCCMFAIKPVFWPDDVVQATRENKALARNELNYLGHEHGAQTNLHRVLDALFDRADEALRQGSTQSEIDTVHVVTDGTPTSGKVIDTRELLEWVRMRNRPHHIRINVITMGATDTHLAFLEALAAANYGTCRIVDEPR